MIGAFGGAFWGAIGGWIGRGHSEARDDLCRARRAERRRASRPVARCCALQSAACAIARSAVHAVSTRSVRAHADQLKSVSGKETQFEGVPAALGTDSDEHASAAMVRHGRTDRR